VLAIGAFTPIGVALLAPLECRFAFSPPDSQAPDGIIVQASVGDVDAVQTLNQDYPKARVIFIGFDWDMRKAFARRGRPDARCGDPSITDHFRGRTVLRRVAQTKAQ